MPRFDIHTAFVIIGLMFLIMSTVDWLLLAGRRSQALAWWCSSGVLQGGSAILTGLNSALPEWAYISLPTFMFMVAHFTRLQALRLDLGRPLSKGVMVLSVASAFAVFEYLHWGLQHAVWRVQFNAGLAAVLIFYHAVLAWQLGKAEPSRSALWIARVYALVAAAMLLRVFTVTGSGGPVNMVTPGLSTQFMAVTILLAAVIGHIGYVGLELDRAKRRELKAAADLARDEESRRLGAQIAHLDRQRSLGQMSAALSHELKQPLSAIMTYAQVAQQDVQSGAAQHPGLAGFLDKIVHNTRRASQIIDRISNYIRPSPARHEPVLLNQAVQEVVALVAAEAHEKRVTIQLPAKQQPAWVKGDAIALSQIVLNVFRNAIDAVAEAPKRDIVVECVTEMGRVILRIRDSGPGLSDNQLTQAGTPFFSTKSTGMGLGLSISKAIAEQHGGTLTVRNNTDSQGCGAVVELALPLSSDQTP